ANESGGPVATQVGTNGDPLAPYRHGRVSEHCVFEVENIVDIDLEETRTLGEAEPEGPPVEAGAQDDDLATPGAKGVADGVVEELGAHDHPGIQPRRLSAGSVEAFWRRLPPTQDRGYRRGQRIVKKAVGPRRLGSTHPRNTHGSHADTLRHLGHDH